MIRGIFTLFPVLLFCVGGSIAGIGGDSNARTGATLQRSAILMAVIWIYFYVAVNGVICRAP